MFFADFEYPSLNTEILVYGASDKLSKKIHNRKMVISQINEDTLLLALFSNLGFGDTEKIYGYCLELDRIGIDKANKHIANSPADLELRKTISSLSNSEDEFQTFAPISFCDAEKYANRRLSKIGKKYCEEKPFKVLSLMAEKEKITKIKLPISIKPQTKNAKNLIIIKHP